MIERYRVNPRAIAKEGGSRLVKVEGKKGVYKIVRGDDIESKEETTTDQGTDDVRADIVGGIGKILDGSEQGQKDDKEESESKLG